MSSSGDIKQHDTTIVFHSGTNLLGKNMSQMAVVCLALSVLVKTLEQRSIEPMERIEHIDFEGMQYRTDIGAKAFK